jgi:hypothetical protein
MTVLKVERNWNNAYSQQTILRDCNGAVKKIISSSIQQPKKNTKTLKINNIEYQLDWSGVNLK